MRPSVWIGIIATAWGTVSTVQSFDLFRPQLLTRFQVMLCQGFVQSYETLIVTRFLLGVTESGFFPAAAFLITTWYCRFEVQTRLALFYTAASLAGAGYLYWRE